MTKIGNREVVGAYKGSRQLSKAYLRGVCRFGENLPTLISATVENAEPTHVVLTFSKAKLTWGASDFTIAGFTISSASWTGTVLTLIISTAVIYGDVVVVTFVPSGEAVAVTNNIAAEAEYTALLTRFDTEPVTEYNKLANQLIKDFKNSANWESTNLWDRSDQILIWIGGKSSANYLLNWKGNTLNPTAVNTPIYTNKGIRTFYPSTGNINLNFNPSSEALNVANTNAAFTWFISRRDTSTGYFGLSFSESKFTGIALHPLGGTTVYGSIAGSLRTIGTTSTRRGLLTLRRTGTTLSAVIAKVQTGSETVTDQGFANLDMSLEGYNDNGTVKSPTKNRISCFIASNYLTDNEVAKLDELINDFYDSAARYGAFVRNVIVCDGNSLTSGTGASDVNHAYPKLMALEDAGWELANLGVGSQRTITMTTNAPLNVDYDFYEAQNNSVLVAWEIINDMAVVSDEEAYANFVNYCQARKDVGWKVIVPTLIAINPISGLSAMRIAHINNLLKANWTSFADAIVLLDENPAFDDYSDLTYYHSDGIHLNDAGYAIVADLVKTAVLEV